MTYSFYAFTFYEVDVDQISIALIQTFSTVSRTWNEICLLTCSFAVCKWRPQHKKLYAVGTFAADLRSGYYFEISAFHISFYLMRWLGPFNKMEIALDVKSRILSNQFN